MTFDDIVEAITDELNITSSESEVRIGKTVNRFYKRVLTSVGLQPSVRAYAEETLSVIGDPVLIWSDMYKITRVYYLTPEDHKVILEQKTWDELRERTPEDGTPSSWAVQRIDANEVEILIDANPTEESTYYADGYHIVPTISDVDEPAFPESFHDILIEGVLMKEYRKRGREFQGEMKECKSEYERRLSDLRLWHAKTLGMEIRQGSRPRVRTRNFNNWLNGNG